MALTARNWEQSKEDDDWKFGKRAAASTMQLSRLCVQT